MNKQHSMKTSAYRYEYIHEKLEMFQQMLLNFTDKQLV